MPPYNPRRAVRLYATIATWLLALGTIQGQQQPTFDISLMVDTVAPISKGLVDQLRNEIRAVVGEDAVIHMPHEQVLSHDFDLERAERNYQQLLASDTDLIIAFGSISSRVISNRDSYPKPTILFGNLNYDLIEIDSARASTGIDNFTYLVWSQSYRRDLEVFHGLTGFKNVGVVVEGPDALVEPIRTVVDQTTRGLGTDYRLIRYESIDSLTPHFETIDAVYIAEGFFIPQSEIEQITRLLIQKELPSFTTTGTEHVEAGLMATRQPRASVEQFLRRVAITAEAVVNGENLADRPILFDAGSTLMVNYPTAVRTHVPLSFSLLATANMVGNFDAVPVERTYSFLEVAEEVVNNNLALAASQKDVELAEQDVQSARTGYLPSLSTTINGHYVDSTSARASGGQNPEYSTTAGLGLNQTLFSNPLNANISIQKSLRQAQGESLEAQRLDLILEAATTYFNVLALKTDALIRRQNLELTKSNLNVAETNYTAGASGRRDLLRFRSELATNTQAFVDSIGKLEQGFYSLNGLLNQPIARKISVEEARLGVGAFAQYDYRMLQKLLEDPSLKESLVQLLLDLAIEASPELKQLRHQRDVTDRSLALNGWQRYLPSIAAQGQYSRNLDQWGAGALPSDSVLEGTFSLGINLSISLFDRNSRNVEKRYALLQQQQLDLVRDDLLRTLEENVHSAVSDLSTRIPNLELSKLAEDTAAESLDLSQASYSNGAITIVELLDAQNNFLRARLASANANYSFLLSALRLERLVGHFFLLSTEAENAAFMNAIDQLASTSIEN